MGALYQISFPNGKSYIGMTVSKPSKRWNEHRYHAVKEITRMPVHRAMKKYGIENCRFEVLAVANGREYLEHIERRAIVAFGTRTPAGYNATDGGDGAPLGNLFNLGKKRTAETRARMSVSQTGVKRKLSDEVLARRIDLMKGNAFGCRTHSAEERAMKQVVARGKSHGASSGFVGVSKHKATGKWRAHLTLNAKFIDLGYYDDINDAISARAVGEEKYFRGC